MGSKIIKIIKAKQIETETKKVTATPKPEGEEKLVVRKITQNINSWIKEHREQKNTMQIPLFAN